MGYYDPKPIPPLAQKDIDRFWLNVDVRGVDECWPWRKGTNHGYGRFTYVYAGVQSEHKAHRIAYFLSTGDDPGPMLDVLHGCDNRPCSNPRHLRKGTPLENNRERSAKGRSASGDRHWTRLHPELIVCPQDHPFRNRKLKQGEKHPLAKITDSDALEIRRNFAAKESDTKQLASRFGISRSMVYQILSRRSWSHI